MAEVDLRQNNFAAQFRLLPPPPECCCGCSVQTGTKIIAIFSLMIELVYIVALGVLLGIGLKGFDSGTARGILIGLVVGYGLLALTNMGFSILLLKGANQANMNYIKSWVIYAKVMAGISITFLVLALVMLNIIGVVWQGLSVAKYIFFIFVVNKFRKDVEENPSRYTQSNGVNA